MKSNYQAWCDYSIWLIASVWVLLGISLYLTQVSNIDFALQKFLFDEQSHQWLIDKDEPVKKMIFYKLPKILFGVAIVVLSLVLLLRKKFRISSSNYRKIFLTFLGLTLIPLIAGNIKKFTNIYCPNQLEMYGGDKPFVRIFDSYPANFIQQKNGQCFPAGHAVTGFALMILFFVFEKKWRLFGLFLGLSLGWIFGFYQMAKGAHFFSDTWVSMLCCFVIADLIARIFNKYHPKS